jgi:hypothetical protein
MTPVSTEAIKVASLVSGEAREPRGQ